MTNKTNVTSIPELLCIGFFCHDKHEDGFILGGTASYSSLMASRLGKQTAVLTSVGADFLFYDTFEKADITIANKIAAHTTIFHNIYQEGHRTQYIYNRANTLFAADVPELWRQTPIVKLCLIADEADVSLLTAFPNALVTATIQGWLRQWDETGKVRPTAMNWEMLKAVDIILLSDADIAGFEDVLPTITKLVKIVVMTKGKEGAMVFYDQQIYHFPAFPVEEVDPTGAGDVFAASFVVQYAACQDIALATSFAHAAASFVVEGVGVQLPSLAAIEQRWAAYRRLFPELFQKI